MLSWPAANSPAGLRKTPNRRSVAARSAPGRIPHLASCLCSTIRRVGGFVGCDHGFVALAHGEQLVLAHDVFPAMLHVVLVDPSEHDGIHRTGFLAETAVDALEKVDVVAARPARTIRRDFGVDRDTDRGTYGLAKLACDTALLPVRIAPQRVQPTETR